MSLHSRIPFFLAGAAASGIALVGLSQPGPVSAQSEQGASNAAPVCMVRMISETEEFPIILPAADVDAMKAKGFEPKPCDADFGTAQQREAWKETICEMASIRTEGVHESFEAKWGERPNVLCGMAEQASSQWKRGRKQ